MEPYYFRIKGVREFLKYYLSIYEGDYNKIKAWKISRLIPVSMRNKNVLDVGSGGGFYSLIVCKRGARDITLLDISPLCIKAAKINLRENINSNPDGIIADATHLPFRNETFNFVICVDVIEHILEDHMVLQEIERVLKSNGLMIIATQNSNSLNYILEAPIQRYVFKNREWMGWDPTHVRFYNPSNLFQMLKKCGFNIIKVTGTYFIPYMLALGLRRINKRISRLLYLALYYLNQQLEKSDKAILGLFGWGIICLCQKKSSKRTKGYS